MKWGPGEWPLTGMTVTEETGGLHWRLGSEPERKQRALEGIVYGLCDGLD